MLRYAGLDQRSQKRAALAQVETYQAVCLALAWLAFVLKMSRYVVPAVPLQLAQPQGFLQLLAPLSYTNVCAVGLSLDRQLGQLALRCQPSVHGPAAQQTVP
jgi:hypothetical protein